MASLHDDDREVIEYDLRDWPDGDRRALQVMLRGEDLDTEWTGPGTFRVDSSDAYRVDELIDLLQRVGSTSEAAPGPPQAGGAAIAGLGRRFLGAAIDSFVLMMTNWMVWTALGAPEGGPPRLLTAAVVAVYEIGGIAVYGRTIGKWCARTRVVDDTSGEHVTLPQAVARFAVPALGMLLAPLPGGFYFELSWSLVVYGLIVVSPRRQGLHDRIAGTVVVGDTYR